MEERKDWTETAGAANDTEALQRVFLLGVRYAFAPGKVVATVGRNARLSQDSNAVLAITTAYSSILAALIRGDKLDDRITEKLLTLVKAGQLPFHVDKGPDAADPDVDYRTLELFPSPDSLITIRDIARAAKDPGVVIEPAWKAAQVYGLSCAIYHQIPAVYYLATRFSDDYEQAVLHALNGGGQNLSRASLTGALVGAQVGLGGIPKRFLDGLEGYQEIRTLAEKLGEDVARDAGSV